MNGKGSRNRSIGKKYTKGYDAIFGKRNPGDGQKDPATGKAKKKSKPIRFEKPKNFLQKGAELVKRVWP